MEEDFNHFAELLAAACSRITADYFQLPVADADAVYRERVYCYELYHRLRYAWNGFPYSLGGEIDKTGHPHFENGPYARAKPDFLVHSPGDMDGNLACVEVKPITGSLSGFLADLTKLTWFHRHAGYCGGILLIYGSIDEGGEEELAGRLAQEMQNSPEIYHRAIRLFRHDAVGREAVRVRL